MKKKIAEPRYNHIDVKVAYACNFRCEYCYQTDKNGMRPAGMLSEENAGRLLSFIDRLGMHFQVTLAGGEPFIYPYLEKLAEGLAKRNCLIMIITNFSASNEKIGRFINICGKSLKEFNISIHISQWSDMDIFYDKLKDFLDTSEAWKFPFHVGCTCVVTEENYEDVKALCENMSLRFPSVSIRLHRVYYDGIYHKYPDNIEEFMHEHSVDVPKERMDDQQYYGKPCWTGCRFFYIESDGTVYRCYTRQDDENDWILGSLDDVDMIRVYREAEPCKTADGGKCVCYEHFENVGFVKNSDGEYK